MFAARLAFVAAQLLLCSVAADGVFVAIVDVNDDGILTIECRGPALPIPNADFRIVNLRTAETTSVQGERYVLDLEDDSVITCAERDNLDDRSEPIQFAGI